MLDNVSGAVTHPQATGERVRNSRYLASVTHLISLLLRECVVGRGLHVERAATSMMVPSYVPCFRRSCQSTRVTSLDSAAP